MTLGRPTIEHGDGGMGPGGRVDDGFAAFGIHLARAGAWQTSEVLWELSANERVDRIFRQGLARSVEMASRGILL